MKDVSKSISQIDETLPKLDNFIKQIITYDKSKNDIEVKLSNFDDIEICYFQQYHAIFQFRNSIMQKLSIK